ncbi:PepSY domain-containing protein [Virgibacillus sp. W0430]|uniref:PepSY domain-containing protein n=1 Tax=Virgibacillus sp. W0430 TaxID=3391580 RepID=UPI003F46CA02
MKSKKMVIAITGIVAAGALFLGIYHSDAAQAEPNLSFEEVEQLVINQYPGTITEMELEKDLNKAVYEVEVESEGKKYDLKLDGDTGEVLKLKEKDLTIKEKESASSKQRKTEGSSNTDQSEKDNSENLNSDVQQTVIDSTEAIQIAQKEFPGTVISFELDENNNRLLYEIEIEAGKEEAEIEIDAYTGEVLVVEVDY